MGGEAGSDQRAFDAGRCFRVYVTGDSAAELELAALDKAREFFGTAPQLAVVPDYLATSARTGADKRYGAGVTIRVVESS
jgi:hypothetical protein